MINGFVIEIKNASNLKHSVRLFSREELPDGVTVTTRNKDYHYKELFSLANSKGFKGSGINADEDGTTIKQRVYSGGTNGSEVVSYVVWKAT